MTETQQPSRITGQASADGDPSAAVATSRVRAATALRRLGHALVGHEADPDLLERIAELADRTAATVEEGTRRSRPIEAIKRRLWESPPPDGGPMGHFPECVVSGKGNPMGIALSVRRDGEEALATVNLGPAFEGAPGRAHGGVVAAVFDDVMGYVLQLSRTPAYTGRLTVSYLAPVPLGRDLNVKAWLEERNGRKLTIKAAMTDDGERICDADALFIAIPRERFGLPPEPPAPQ